MLVVLATASARAQEGTNAQGTTNETELSIAQVSGNSNSETYGAKESLAYVWEADTLKASGRYLQGRTEGVESVRAWDAGLRYERSLSPVWSVFASHSLESDIFSGFVQRNNTDIGAKYFFTKTQQTVWSAELGYRYVTVQYVAIRPDVNNYDHTARVYSEITESLGPTVNGKFWIEYIPNLTDSEAYLINAEPSITAILSNALSLKLSYLVKYQNPNKAIAGVRAYTDTTFLTSLVAKF
jgi:putative salt-induced outer membrane protein